MKYYAIKMIQLFRFNDKLINEVTLLSSLSHPNIVRYFQAWTEDEVGEVAEADSGDQYQ